ncbi:MAG: phospholipase D-like domain-containing protein [Elusimicrobiota bacterium]
MNHPTKRPARASFIKRLLSACFAFGLLATSAFAAFTVPGFELVSSWPVETSLEPAGLRTAAQVWPEMIASSKKTLDIAQFYVTNKLGEPLEPVISQLRKAGERGVRIRFIAERKMSPSSMEGFELLRTIPNLELRVIDFSAIKKDGIHHAKYFIVDGREAYMGSQNFDWRSLKHIHELGLRVEEPAIAAQMSAIFEQDWKACGLSRMGRPVARLNRSRPKARADQRAYMVASPWAFNPPGVGDSESELVRLLGTAKSEVLIQLLDYAPLTRKKKPYLPIDTALRAAAARGVRVRLMVSHWNTESPAVDHLKNLSRVPNAEVRIVTIPEAKEGRIPFSRVIHSKYMVLDQKLLWLGTSNWSGGYMDNSRNLELIVKDDALAKRARDIHAQLWDSPYAEPIEMSRKYPKPRR